MEKTTAISTVTVPVIAGWKCSKCGAPNASKGTIKVYSSSTVHSTSRRAVNEAKARAHDQLEATWKSDALNLIMSGVKSAHPYYDGNIKIDDCSCIDCKKREIWSYNGLERLTGILITLPLLVIILSIVDLTDSNTPAWKGVLALLISIGLIISAFQIEKIYFSKFQALDKDSIPQLITVNKDILDYAASKGIIILDANRTPNVYIGLEYKTRKAESTDNINTENKVVSGSNEEKREVHAMRDNAEIKGKNTRIADYINEHLKEE